MEGFSATMATDEDKLRMVLLRHTKSGMFMIIFRPIRVTTMQIYHNGGLATRLPS